MTVVISPTNYHYFIKNIYICIGHVNIIHTGIEQTKSWALTFRIFQIFYR